MSQKSKNNVTAETTRVITLMVVQDVMESSGIFGNLWESSGIFGNLLEYSGISGNLRESSGILGTDVAFPGMDEVYPGDTVGRCSYGLADAMPLQINKMDKTCKTTIFPNINVVE